MPVSVTSKCSIVDLSVRACSSTARPARAPLAVNLIALPTRFDSTWRTGPDRRRSRSGTSGWMSHISSSPFSSALTASGFSCLLHQLADRERNRLELELARFDLREVEDVVEDREQRIGRRLDRHQVVALMLVEAGVERQLGHADDPVHRGADLVAHVGQEFALRAAGFHRLVARPSQVGVGRCAARTSGRRPVRSRPACCSCSCASRRWISTSMPLKPPTSSPISSSPPPSARTS